MFYTRKCQCLTSCGGPGLKSEALLNSLLHSLLRLNVLESYTSDDKANASHMLHGFIRNAYGCYFTMMSLYNWLANFLLPQKSLSKALRKTSTQLTVVILPYFYMTIHTLTQIQRSCSDFRRLCVFSM